jgi:hypothetical protein
VSPSATGIEVRFVADARVPPTPAGLETPFAGGRVDEIATVHDLESGSRVTVLVWRCSGQVRFRMGIRPNEGGSAVWSPWTAWRKGEAGPVESPGV